MLSAVRKQGLSCDLLVPIVVGLEALMVFVAGVFGAKLVNDWGIGRPAAAEVVILATILGMVLVAASLHSAETYTSRSLALPPHPPLRVMGVTLVVCCLAGLFVTLLGPSGPGWQWGAAWAVMAAMLLGISRLSIVPALRGWMPSTGMQKQIAVIGAGDDSDEDLAAIDQEMSALADRNCISLFYRRPDDLESAAGERWVEHLRQDGIEEVVILPELHSDRQWINQAVRTLEALPIRVSLAIPRPAIDSNRPGYVFAALIDQPLSPQQQAVKRLFDVAVSLVLLLFLAPLMLLTALLIKLDSEGPVLFTQQRYGFGKRIIHVYKYRSMYTHMSDQMADRLTERDDPRVTRVGAFIRRFSIDELPQLINVLRGEMSMVGPRPNPLNAKAGGELYDRVVDNFYTRYRVLPGITGWAQVNGLRGNTDTKEKLIRRVEFDLHYIRNWSIWLDLKIVLLTPIASLEGENAF